MGIRFDHVEKALALMRDQGWLGSMVMNHDDYRYFLGRDWAQPRAIIPAEGPPVLIAFSAEEPELRQYASEPGIRVFSHVGGADGRRHWRLSRDHRFTRLPPGRRRGPSRHADVV